MRRTLGNMLGRATAPLLVAVVVAGALAVQAPASDPVDLPATTPVLGVQGQVHIIPWDAQQFLDILRGQQGSATSIESPVRLITSIVSALDGNQIAIDHWEDGYDADPVTAPGTTTQLLSLNEGQSTVLNNLVDVGNLGDIDARGTNLPYYDGGDKLVSSGAVVVTAGGWPSNAGTLHAGAAVVQEVDTFGQEFVSPVGEDTTYPAPDAALNTLWEYVGLVTVAAEDDTVVTLPGGSTVTLDSGDTHLVDGGVQLGDAVTADKPIGVFLATGDNGGSYEGRLYSLSPVEAWSSDYMTPVGSRNAAEQQTRVFFYNPSSSALTVTVTRPSGATSTVSVPAEGQANHLMVINEGARFSASSPFYAIQAVTTPEDGFTDRSSAYNWGFALTPTSALTPMLVVGYGPGSEGLTKNDSAVWVTAASATTIYVDRNADTGDGALTDPFGNQYDFSCAMTALSPRLVVDNGGTTCTGISDFNEAKGTGDADMTGARIYTVDGTPLAAAWGQVPGIDLGVPAIDMGTTVLPFPSIDLDKDSEILNDDGDGEAVPGDTLRYTITITNRGISPVDDLVVNDEVPENTTYVPGSTTAGGNPVADPGTGTPFPLDEGGLDVPPVLGVGESRTVTYDLLVDDPLPEGVTEILNEITLESDYGIYTDIEIVPVADPGSIGDRVWNDADGDGVQDGAETGLVGVTVELVNGDDEVVDTTTTGVNGAYTFAEVYPGTYTVRVVPSTLPPAMAATFDFDGVATANQTSVTLAPAQVRTDVDFGYATASITLQKTVYAGHNGGNSCPGTEQVSGENGDAITYCFRVTNSGTAPVVGVGVDDADLGIDETDMQVESGSAANLAAGQSVVFSYSGASIDGDLVNTAEAEAFISLGGPAFSDTDTAEVVEVGPGVSIAKTVYQGHDGGAGCPGTDLLQVRSGVPLTYCFVITNTGETNLSAVSITDADLGIEPGDIVIPLLTPGQTATRYVQVSADGDLVNTADVVGTSPAGVQPTDEDTAEIDEIHPVVTLDKTVYTGHDDGASCAGGEAVTTVAGTDVTWCFLVRNEGDVPLADVTVVDLPILADETDMTVLSGDLDSIPAGGEVVLYLEAEAAGDLPNTATAAGSPPVGPDVSDTDPAAIDVIDPSITLYKTVYAGHDDGAGCDGDDLVQGEPGDDITYCFRVANAAGEGDLTDVRLDDADLGVDEGDLSLLSGDVTPLADGTSATWYLETTVDDDLVNTATATATPVAGPDVSDEDTAEVDEVNAAISIDKAVYGGHDDGDQCDTAIGYHTNENGTPVTWCFTVTNSGDAVLTDVTVDDADLGVDDGDLTVLSGSLASLAPGATVVLYLEGSVDGDLVNTATTSGTPPVGEDVTDEDSAEINELVPSVSIEKTVYRGHDGGASCQGVDRVIARAGAPVTWCFLVTNTGDTDVYTQVTDPAVGLDEDVDLSPGASTTLFVEGTVAGDLVNTGTVTGDSPGGHPVEDEDTAEVDEVHPGLRIDKTVYGGHDGGQACDGGETHADESGQPVTWCFTVTNMGDTDLTDITIDDVDLGVDQSDLTVVSGSLALLEPGGAVVLHLDGTLDVDLTNSATATGVPPVGPDVTDDDTATVTVLVPGVTIDKTVYAGHDSGAGCQGTDRVVARSGADVTWCFLVTNTGEVPLDITVDDADLGYADTVDDLAPGASVTLHHEGTVDGDLLNTATTTGDTPDGDEVEDEDGADVDEIHPAIHIEKTVYPGHDGGAGCAGADALDGEDGDAVTWCFAITNTGDAGLTGITVDDPVLGADEEDLTVLSGTLDALAADATIMAYLEGTVDGDQVNTATADGTAPDGSGVTDSDTAEVTVIAPQIGIAKTIVDGPTGNGDGTYTLTYRLRVANAGETRLDDVQVTDDLTATFAGVRGFTVDDVAGTDLTVNPDFDGRPSGSTYLLAGIDQLEVGAVGEVEVTVTVDPGDELGPYLNTAFATGTSPGGADADDSSDSGSDADPTDPNSGEPGDSGGTDDPVPVVFPAVDLTVEKGVASTQVDGDRGVIDWRIVVYNNGPGDDSGPITVTDELDERLGYVSATGDGWDCAAAGQVVTCVWDAPLPAGQATSDIQVLTDVTITRDETITNGAHVASTSAESRTDNNDAAAEAQAVVDGQQGTLPRTGAAIGGLVLLGLGLVLGGRLLQRRSAALRGVA